MNRMRYAEYHYGKNSSKSRFQITQQGNNVDICREHRCIGNLNLDTMELQYADSESFAFPLLIGKLQTLAEIRNGQSVTVYPGSVVFFTTIKWQIEDVLTLTYDLPSYVLAEVVKQSIREQFAENDNLDDMAFLILQRPLERDYPKFQLELDSTFESIDYARNQVTSFLSEYLKNSCVNLWCFQEMIVNAIEHGNRFSPDKKVRINVEVTERHIMFVISDEGDGFNWRERIHKESCLLSSSERGRGIVMSEMLCTYMIYNEIGNQVTIIFTYDEPI